MKAEQSTIQLNSHVYQKKNENYKGISFCDNRKSFIDQRHLVKSDYSKNKSTAQMRFNIQNSAGNIRENYISAAQAWTACANQVNAFVNAYDNNPNFANQNMEDNMIRKSRKAATTIAGEAFEVFQWRPVLNQQNQQNDHYYGPGGHAGVDIMYFNNNNAGEDAEEVKSRTGFNWRNAFVDVDNDIRRIAYLEEYALIDALDDENEHREDIVDIFGHNIAHRNLIRNAIIAEEGFLDKNGNSYINNNMQPPNNNINQIPLNQRYYFYDKNNPNGLGGFCFDH